MGLGMCLLVTLWWIIRSRSRLALLYTKHTWAANLCDIHIFRCLSEGDEQISLETEYPERKQKTTGCKYVKQKSLTVTQDFRSWSGLRLFKEHSLLYYPCFNTHCPWHHHPNHLFSLFSSSPHGKWLPEWTKQFNSTRILCNWDPWREKKKCNCHLKTYWNFCKWFYK